MNGSKAEIKVGFTVLVAIAILVIGVLWIKGVNLKRDYRELAVWFPNVGSLEIGDPVTVAGVRRGKVRDIALDRGGVRTTIQVGRDVDLRTDAVFSIKNVGLMGERFIDIQPGTASDPLPGEPMPQGLYETGIPEIMGLMGQVTDEIRQLVVAVRSTIGSDESLSRLATVSENLSRLSKVSAEMFESQRTGVARALEDLGVAAGDLRATMSATKETVTQAAHRFDSAAVKLYIFADRLDTLSTDVRRVVNNVEHGDGSMARLLNDDQLVRRWEATAGEIDALVADIRANPKKYLNVQIRVF